MTTPAPSFGYPVALYFCGGEPAAAAGHRTGSADRSYFGGLAIVVADNLSGV